MRIKILLLSSIVALIAFASCKKTNTVTVTKLIEDSVLKTSADTLSASFNDTSYLVYNENWGETGADYGWRGNDSTKYYYFETGAQDSTDNNYNYLEVDIYTLNGLLSVNKTYGLTSDTTTEIYLYFYNNAGGYFESNGYKQAPATATITSISGNVITGTFSGTLFQYGDTTSTYKKVVTNGKFTSVF